MKKDMSEHGQVINGSRTYREGDIYKTIDHRLNIKQPCDTFDNICSNKTSVATQDVQIQTREASEAGMTIKSIINDKVTELNSHNNNELQNKLTRMEEENLRLRNRNRLLEDRITLLEKQCKIDDSSKEVLISSLANDVPVTEDGMRVNTELTFFQEGGEPTVSEGDVSDVPSSLSVRVHFTAPASSPSRSTNVMSYGLCNVTQPCVTYTCGISPDTIDVSSVSDGIPTLRNNSDLAQGREEVSRSEVSPAHSVSMNSPISLETSDATSVFSSSMTSESRTDSPNFKISVEKTNTGDLILKSSPGGQSQGTTERPPSTLEASDSPDVIIVTPDNVSSTMTSSGAMSEMSIVSDELSRSRPKEIYTRKETPLATRDANRSRPRDSSVSPRNSEKYSPVSKPITGFYKNDFYESPPEPRNPKVIMYENQLLGEPMSSPQTPQREFAEPRRRDVSENFPRDPNFVDNHANSRDAESMRLNAQRTNNSYPSDEKYSSSAPAYSGFRSASDLPRSSSDPSIFPNNPRDKRVANIANNSNSMVVLRDQTVYNPNDIRVADGLTSAREYMPMHAESVLSNEAKLDKLQNAYMNTANSMHHPMQRDAPNPMNQSMHRITETCDKSISEMRRYDASRRREILNSPSTSLKSSLKRTQVRPSYPESRLVEYEPLSKVSVNPPRAPPPLIPNPNLSPSRYPGRTMNVPRSPVLRPAYPVPNKYSNPAANYPSTTPNYPTTAKYNVSATNFHAISRTNNYQMSSPNYMNAPANYPNLYDNRVGLPQLVAHITSDKSSIIFTWDKVDHTQMYLDNVDVYFLFAFHTLDLNQPPPKESTYWKRISIVKALPLPIACTLTQSFDGQNYFFAVAAVNRQGAVGQLSNPCALKVAL